MIIIVTWQDEFVRLAGAHKHPRSVVGAREMDLSAGSGAPEFVGVQSSDEDPRGHSGQQPFSPHRGAVRTSKLQAQSGFDGERWM